MMPRLGIHNLRNNDRPAHRVAPSVAVAGQWTPWAAWSRCTTTCDWCVQTRDRMCASPAPSPGGKPCTGPGSELLHCYHQPCTGSDEYANHILPIEPNHSQPNLPILSMEPSAVSNGLIVLPSKLYLFRVSKPARQRMTMPLMLMSVIVLSQTMGLAECWQRQADCSTVLPNSAATSYFYTWEWRSTQQMALSCTDTHRDVIMSPNVTSAFCSILPTGDQNWRPDLGRRVSAFKKIFLLR